MLLELVRTDPICRRLMSAPGVGPIVALTFRTCVDNPARFSRSKCVGAHYGLTPRLYQSGEVARTGRISRCGDVMLRSSLYEAALAVLTGPGRWNPLKAWGIAVARRRGMQKAIVAVARKLAIVLHRMWRDDTTFRRTAPTARSRRSANSTPPRWRGRPARTTGSGETEETRAAPQATARLRWLQPILLIPS